MTNDQWSLRSLATETWRNSTARPYSTALLLFIATLMVASIATIEIVQLNHIRTVNTEAELAGRDVFQVLGTDLEISSIDAAKCQNLSNLDAVESAGHEDAAQPIQLLQYGGATYASASVSQGTLQTWDPSWITESKSDPQVFLGSVVADELGLKRGDSLLIDTETVATVGGVLSNDNRYDRAERWILNATPSTGETDACWVEFEPGTTTQVAQDTLRSAFPESPDAISVRRLIPNAEASLDAAISVRFGRSAALGGGGFLGAILLLARAARRKELAVYSLTGMNRTSLMFLELFASGSILSAALLGGFQTSLILIAGDNYGEMSNVLLRSAASSMTAVIVAFIVFAVGVALFPTRSPFESIRE